MPQYSVGLDIAAPAGRVFAEIADLSRHPLWSADPLEITPAGAGAVGPGKAYRSRATVKGRVISADLTVTEHAPPARFAFAARDVTGAYVHEFSLRDGATTHVERHVVATLGLKEWLFFRLVFRLVKLPNSRRALQRLKEHCERDPVRPDPVTFPL